MRLAACIAALAAAACLAIHMPHPDAPRLVAQSMSRAQIRSLPIEARPNRPIHLYGNAVRRRHQAAPVRPLPAR